jgi:predicted deacylase
MKYPRSARNFTMLAAAMLAAAGAQAATVFTGDKVQGVAVISQLDVSDLAPGKTHRFMFQGVEMGTGQHWYVPVMVAKGAKDGKRLLLVSGVHGDELNPIRVVQKVFADLDATKLSGSVIGIIGPSRPGVEHVTRMWPVSNLGVNLINPNRTWPGNEAGNTVERHSWLVMNRLIKGNADIGVDIHTGGNGIDFALFAFANWKDAEAQQIAQLFPIDQILLEPGFDGTLEYALVRAGIPAITLELGGPRSFDAQMIASGTEGAENLLAHYKMLDRPLGQTAKDRQVFVGNKLADLFAVQSGFTEVLVKLNDTVKKGQKVAVQHNAFGDVVHEYFAEVDGRVAIIGTDAIRERGVDIVSILTNSSECASGNCPYAGDEP